MIKLVVDSGSCLAKEYIKENDITLVKFNLLVADKQIIEPDIENINDFYKLLEENKGVAKTSQPSVDSYESAFKYILNENNEVICICMASKLSGAYNCAEMVAKQINSDKISVIDSHILIQGTKILVEEAVKLIKENKTRLEIVEHLNKLKSEIEINFIPQSLEPLKRGGRIGTLSALLGSVLNIKPILKFKDNILTCYKKVMGMQKGIKDLISAIPATCKKIYAMCVYKSNFFQNLVSGLKAKHPHLEIIEENVSPTVGIHVGISCIGITFAPNK